MSAATFPCPHCGATYPVKPVLIGKTVRCTACKNPFRLRPDGVADKAQIAPAAPVTAPVAAAAPVTPPPPRQPDPRVAAQAKAQEEARRAMSASLTAAISKFSPEPTPPVSAARSGKTPNPPNESKPKTDRVPSERLSKTSKASDRKKPKKPVILTDEGEREAAISRNWMLAFAAAALLIIGIGWLLSVQSARRQAIDTFTAEITGPANRYGYRIEAIQARAWLPVTPFTDLRGARLGSVTTTPGSSLGPAVAQLKGLVYVPTIQWWTSPERVDWLTTSAAKNPTNVPAAIEKAGITAISRTAIIKALGAAGLGDDDTRLVLALLTQRPASGTNPWIDRILNGTDLTWCTVSGTNGSYLFNPGQNYTSRTADFEGILLRDGTVWKFAVLGPVKKP